MPLYLLDKAYKVSAPVSAGAIVVADSVAGVCKLPAAANAGKILGIAVSSQSETGRAVTIRKAGTAEVRVAGAVNPGDPLMIADNTGKAKIISEVPGTKVECIGFAETKATAANQSVEVFICIHQRTT